MMQLTSSAFEHEGNIPAKYTCEGHGVNPPLTFSEVPSEAKSLVLLMDDPDVPAWVRKECMFDHWVVYNIPSHIREFEENSTPPGVEGKNTSGKIGYYGPCPPDREHRYYFMLYALDSQLQLPRGATKDEVIKAMAGHILAKAELMGLYEKKTKN